MLLLVDKGYLGQISSQSGFFSFGTEEALCCFCE
jgi:hypothetical protein